MISTATKVDIPEELISPVKLPDTLPPVRLPIKVAAVMIPVVFRFLTPKISLSLIWMLLPTASLVPSSIEVVPTARP